MVMMMMMNIDKIFTGQGCLNFLVLPVILMTVYFRSFLNPKAGTLRDLKLHKHIHTAQLRICSDYLEFSSSLEIFQSWQF